MWDEFEDEVNTYARHVADACEAHDRAQGASSDPQPEPAPPQHSFPRLYGNGRPGFDDLTPKIERDVHLGRYVLLRLLVPVAGCEAGERVRTTETEAGEAVRRGLAEYVPVPVVRRSAMEQVTTARAIRRGCEAGNGQ